MKFSACIIISLILLGCSNHLYAQEISSDKFFYYGGRLHYGSMIIHSRAIKDIGNAYPFGIELTFGRQAAGQEAWDACNCYPRIGINLNYWNFNKPEILGSGILSTFFIEPTFGTWKKTFFSFKAALGIAYLTRPYDEETNPYNLSYSTSFSFPLHLGISINYRYSEKIDFNATFIYNHISNGGLREPNKGINWPTVAVGLDYKPRSIAFIKRSPGKLDLSEIDRLNTSFSLFATIKQLSHEEFTKYFIGGANVESSYRVSRLSSLSLGADFEWDESDKEEIKRLDSINMDHKKLGVAMGHQFILGKFLFNQYIGVYLRDQYKANDPVYQKYSLSYRLSNHFEVGLLLKAHRQVADYLAIKASVNL